MIYVFSCIFDLQLFAVIFRASDFIINFENFATHVKFKSISKKNKNFFRNITR